MMKITNKPSFYYTEDGARVDTFQVEFTVDTEKTTENDKNEE